MDFNWTDGNGERRVVFVKQGTTGEPVPVNGATYTASTMLGSGSQIDSSGWYCVFNGTAHPSGATVSGLTGNMNYRIMVCEYNGTAGSEVYNASLSTNNPVVRKTILMLEEQTGISLTGVDRSSVAWGDYDNDGDLDILLCGEIDYNFNRATKIYRNNGDNTFTEQTTITLTGVEKGSVAWEIMITMVIWISCLQEKTGGDGNEDIRNNGDNSFRNKPDFADGNENGSVAWGDQTMTATIF
jgi:hypothetical protein